MCVQNRSMCVLAATVSMAAMLTLLVGCPLPPDGMGNTNDNGTTNANANVNVNANANVNDNGGTAAKAFVGAATCQPCHTDMHADWSETAHATAIESLRAIGQDTNAACLACHTVGFGETDGFVDEATTPELANVQCENCHGPAGDHARNPGDLALRPTVSVSAAICGECHTDPHHPTYDEWQLSRHAMALAGLRSSSHASDNCLECHSQDYRYALELQDEGRTVEVPTIDTAEYSLECATCHAPHGGVDQDHQLRLPVANLCGECHTQGEEALPGGSPHHPQLEMATGTGAVDADSNALTVAFSPHASLFSETGLACAQCHVVMHEVEEPNEGNPNVTGHTFNPFDESITAHQAEQYTGCLMCHGDASVAEMKRTSVQAEIQAELDRLAPFFDDTSDSYIDPETLSDADQTRLAAAKFNFDFVAADGSTGVHNSFYARAALAVTDEVVTDLAP